ncbi:hypothetical protein [Dictyobacter kobayashii]|uniref:hypothetical protein n=1 Tax=Dictyobacter kobayashii TaxID=2014872 RepID=UPI000F81D676|nr:hypothetical protein [Dictyobacter kobayashii]
MKTLLNEAQFEQQSLTGNMLGTIGTPDANRYPHYLHLDLKLREDVLTGATVALTLDDRGGGAQGGRVGNALSYWTELRKEP